MIRNLGAVANRTVRYRQVLNRSSGSTRRTLRSTSTIIPLAAAAASSTVRRFVPTDRRKPNHRSASTGTSNEIAGKVAHVLHQNSTSGWCVALVSAKDAASPTKDETTTVKVTGILPDLKEGMNIKLAGRWLHHATYGDQFSAVGFQLHTPRGDPKGLMLHLAATLPGVGKTLARRIVEKFGDDTETMLSGEDSAMNLHEVEGIGKEKAKLLLEVWGECQKANKGLVDVLNRLHQFGVNYTRCKRIAEKYGEKALKIIDSDPYRLYREISGISFALSDRIAMSKADFAPDNPLRISAAVRFVLEEAKIKGNSALPLSVVVDTLSNLLKFEQSKSETLVGNICSNDIVFSSFEGVDYAQLPELAKAENDVARFLNRNRSKRPKLDGEAFAKFERALATKYEGYKLSGSQMDAIRNVYENGVAVITGGPGCGKTSIIPAIQLLLKPKRVELVALTGRAAKRLDEFLHGGTPVDETVCSVHEKADPWQDYGVHDDDDDYNYGDNSHNHDDSHSDNRNDSEGKPRTIHSLLQFRGDGHFEYCEGNRLDADCVIVDEASMVDISLAASLIRALPDGCDLVLVGDSDQLPPIGAGNFLQDLIKSGRVPTTRLETIFRQEANSSIVECAHAVNQGDIFLEKEQLCTNVSDLIDNKQFQFVDLQGRKDAAQVVGEVHAFLRNQDRDAQILVPQHSGALGTVVLNQMFQHQNKRPKLDDVPFKVGDKVMQTMNNYELGLLNGSIGVVEKVDFSKCVTINFGDSKVRFENDAHELQSLVLAYAISIHKSQGSEYPAAIVIVSESHKYMLQRKLLYTAITRAKERVVVIGDASAYKYAVGHNPDDKRCSLLYRRLQ